MDLEKFKNKKCVDLLYHGKDIVLVDSVIDYSDKHIIVNVNLKENCNYLDKLDEQLIFPMYKSIEMMAQSLGCYQYILLSALNENNKNNAKIGFLLGVRKFEILKPYILFNEELYIHTTLTIQNDNGFGVYDSIIYLNSIDEKNIIAKATLSVFSPEDDFIENVRNNKEYKF